jgi:hypothetical protein
MAITTTRIECGIYLNRWIGDVSLDEVYIARDHVITLARQDHCDRLIVVIDGTRAGKMPISLRGMRNTIPMQTQEVVVFGAPFLGEILIKMLKSFVSITFTILDNESQAVEYAKEIIQPLQS